VAHRVYRAAVVAMIAMTLASFGCGSEDASLTTPPTQSEDPGKQGVRDFWTLNREANRLRLAEDYEKASEAFRRCLEINPEHEDSLYYLGSSLEGMGEYAEAAEAYRRMIALNPSSNRAISQLAHILATPYPGAPSDLKEARALLGRSIELNREHSGPYLSLGRSLLDQGRFADAAEAFETAAQFGSAEGTFLTGYAAMVQGQTTKARPAFRQVLNVAEEERKLQARGGKQEGDVAKNAGLALNPVFSAAIRARLLLDDLDDPPRSSWRDVTTKSGFRPGGGRAAWGDFDLDGDIDAVVVGPGPVRFYRNSKGAFKDIASASVLSGLRGFWDACWGDYDADGDPDLYLIASGHTGVGRNRLFENQGHGAFRESASFAAISGDRNSIKATFVDLDGDGQPEIVEAGTADEHFGALRVFRYGGDAWTETSAAWSLEAPGTLVDVALGDFDSDGRVDICLVPWKKPLMLYRNEGGGKFADVTETAGLRGIRGQGFSTIFFDFDRDGAPDLLHTHHVDFAQVASFLTEPKTSGATASILLFRNTGKGGFEPVLLEKGFASLARSMGVMQVEAGDLDGDGRPDLVFANGSLGGGRIEPSIALRSVAGKGFDAMEVLANLANFQGVSVVDVDGDGRPEIYLAGNRAFNKSAFEVGLLLRTVEGGK